MKDTPTHMHTPTIHLTRGFAGCRLAVELRAVTIMVDALRASVTIPALLEHGVRRVLVVAEVEDARALAARQSGAVLVGERGGECLPGFALGNSPLELAAVPRMEGHTAVFTSSNGAQRLTACLGAPLVMVGSLANAWAVVSTARQTALREGRPIVLVSAGKYPDESFISPEDEASCAYLAMRIGLPIAEDSTATFARWEREIILHNLEEIFRASRHARRLMEIGYADDVLFCARPDTLTALPIVTGPVLLDDRRVGVVVEEMPAR